MSNKLSFSELIHYNIKNVYLGVIEETLNTR